MSASQRQPEPKPGAYHPQQFVQGRTCSPVAQRAQFTPLQDRLQQSSWQSAVAMQIPYALCLSSSHFCRRMGSPGQSCSSMTWQVAIVSPCCLSQVSGEQYGVSESKGAPASSSAQRWRPSHVRSPFKAVCTSRTRKKNTSGNPSQRPRRRFVRSANAAVKISSSSSHRTTSASILSSVSASSSSTGSGMIPRKSRYSRSSLQQITLIAARTEKTHALMIAPPFRA